jgi:hypothetical protein
MESNLNLKSNVMVTSKITISTPEKSFLPGDLYAKFFPEHLDPQSRWRYMTKLQNEEYEQYLECYRCGQVCAGLCGST